MISEMKLERKFTGMLSINRKYFDRYKAKHHATMKSHLQCAQVRQADQSHIRVMNDKGTVMKKFPLSHGKVFKNFLKVIKEFQASDGLMIFLVSRILGISCHWMFQIWSHYPWMI